MAYLQQGEGGARRQGTSEQKKEAKSCASLPGGPEITPPENEAEGPNRSLQNAGDSDKSRQNGALGDLASSLMQAGTTGKVLPMPKDAARRGIKAPLPPCLPHSPLSSITG